MKKSVLLLALFFSLRAAGQGSWQLVPDLPPANFWVHSISVVNENVVWAIADSFSYANNFPTTGNTPIVLRTTDGGATWQSHPVAIAVNRFAWDIHGLDEQTAIFTTNQFNAADNRPIFKTSDGGSTWKKIVPPNNSGGVFVHFFDSKNGAVINRSRVSHTTDSGETWTPMPTANIPTFASDEYNLLSVAGNYIGYNGDRLWFGTSKGRIFRSLDRGNHWQAFQVANSNELISSIAFTDSLHGVALVTGTASIYYETSKVLSTDDGGLTWTQQDPAPVQDVQIVAAVPGAPNVFFMGAYYEIDGKNSYPVFTRNVNSTEDWVELKPDSMLINAFDFISPTVGFAAGSSLKKADEVTIGNDIFSRNYFLKWTGSVLAARENAVAADLKISPNPARDVLRFDFEGFEMGKTTRASVSSAAGQTLFSKEILDGKLDIGGLPTGFYFLKIETDGRVAVGKFLKR